MTRLQLQNDISNISQVTSQNSLIQDAINFSLQRIYSAFDFPYYLQDKGVIKTVDDYSTGKVDVVNGSTTINGTAGSLPTFTQAMVGRKIRIQNQNPYYKILQVNSATQITLEQPFQGSNATGQTYNIFQDEYRLASDLDKFKTFRQAENSIALFQMPITIFDELHPMPTAFADPIYSMMIGTKLDNYSTGTVSGAANSNTITGSGTAWTSVDGLGRMSKITVPMTGTTRNVYTIKSVDSDTQITVYETISSTISAASTYQITMNNVVVQLYQIPNAQRLLYYRYFRIPEPLANDWDIPDLPHSWHWLLVYGSLSFIYLYKGDMKNAQDAAEIRFKEGIAEMKLKLGSFAPDMIYKRRSVDRIPRNISDGLESSNYDRKWSTP